MNTGLFKITSHGLIDHESKNKLLVKLKKRLSGIISEKLIEEIAEY